MQLPKTYEPKEYESDIYALWEKSEAFSPQGNGKTYSIVVPPPNANGDLHLGHGLTLALQDIAVRFHRLLGERALLLPGADHAGFETQVVYEKELAKQGKSRFDFTRQELYKNIWDFVSLNRDNLEGQYRSLGASVDWQNYTFTLDDKVINRAYKTFKQLWDDGLVYRGERLVNFCTFHGTAFADIEVEHREEQGSLWSIRYPLVDGSGEVVVATTRPETMFGDVAVAVHPDDPRYKDYIGKTVKLPLTERQIPILADEFVDQEFGTGAVKITPAHDPNDFEVGERHDLPKVSVISSEGKMIDVPSDFINLDVAEAREKTVKALEEQGFLVSTTDHTNSVGRCYKCETVIQPLLREQWFINMRPLAERAIKALNEGKITFYPDSRRTQLITYLENLRDWNISRQIIWGIPIPAFVNIDNPDDWIFDDQVDQEFITKNDKTYRRDSDVFDTWFSSGQWPFATLGYPDDKKYADFYPLSLMETGADILMPWVSRMIMLGLYVTDEVPFTSVYLHGLVLDSKGQKFSKSKGNGINPQEVIEKYGSDALRLGLITGQSAGNNQPFIIDKVVSGRNFCNKLWNISRFVMQLTPEDFTPGKITVETNADHWVLQKLQHAQNSIHDDLQNYRFNEAYEKLYHFIWDDLADWYIEASKTEPNQQLLVHVLESALALAHPFMPFVTETIWQALEWRSNLLIQASWPKNIAYDNKKAENFTEIQTIITESRYIVRTLKAHDVTLYHNNDQLIVSNKTMIERMSRLQAVQAVESGVGVNLVQTKRKCWLDIDKQTARNYVDELQVKLKDNNAVVERLKQRLANKSYTENAPKQIIEQTKQQLTDAELLLQNISSEVERFSV